MNSAFELKDVQHKNNNELKIVPIGGVEEIGINCTAYEYKSDIVVIDCGLGFPENDQYGVDYLIPNVDFLKKNIKKIKGIFITHSHYDHIGALDLVLKRLKFPAVYAPPFASEIIKHKLKETKILQRTKIIVYRESDIFNFQFFHVTFFRVTHSTPDSYGIILKTPIGNIIHTGDFKFDNSPIDEVPSNYLKIAKAGSEGVIALLSDSTNAFKKGFSKSELEVKEILKDVVEKSNGRLIFATFSQLVTRINQLLQTAILFNRKVAISGRSLELTINIARRLKYINVPDNLFVSLKSIYKLPLQKQMIFVTGHQGETMAALSRIARGEHKDVKIQKGDTVILSSSVIPGNDVLVQKMIDDLSKQGARVFHQGILDLHAGGHGYQEDQKLMINLTKPKFFIPIHGYHSFLSEHIRTAISLGMKENHCIIANNGEEIIINKNSIRRGKKYKSTPVIVSGLGVGDIGEIVLSERDKLANFGIIIVQANINKAKRKLFVEPEIITKGFVFEKAYRGLLNNVQKLASNIIKQGINSNKSIKQIKTNIEKQILKYVKKEIEREPMIIAIINAYENQSHT